MSRTVTLTCHASTVTCHAHHSTADVSGGAAQGKNQDGQGQDVKIQDLPPSYQSQATRQLAARPIPRAPAVAEADLQAEVEAWLAARGYARRTPAEICARATRGRWQVHLIETKRNPILLDLILFDARGRYLEIELKTETGDPTPAQAALLARGEGLMCRSLSEVQAAVTAWEAA